MLQNFKNFLSSEQKDITTGANIFSEILNAFDKFGLDLSTLCGIATDGARAMSGANIRFVDLLKSALKEKNINENIAIQVALFLKNKGRSMTEMEDKSFYFYRWQCNLAFLVDITTRMNELNIRLQRKAQ